MEAARDRRSASDRAPRKVRRGVSVRDPDIASLVSRSFLAEVATQALETIFAHACIMRLPAGVVIYDVADDHITLIFSGVARAFLMAESGRRVPLGTLNRGAAIGVGLIEPDDHALALQAVGECLLLLIPRREAEACAWREPSLLRSVALEASRQLQANLVWLQRTKASVRVRLFRELLAASDAQGAVATTHSELADEIGTAREVVSRLLTSLRREGIIRVTRRHIDVVDRARIYAELGLESAPMI